MFSRGEKTRGGFAYSYGGGCDGLLWGIGGKFDIQEMSNYVVVPISVTPRENWFCAHNRGVNIDGVHVSNVWLCINLSFIILYNMRLLIYFSELGQ